MEKKKVFTRNQVKKIPFDPKNSIVQNCCFILGETVESFNIIMFRTLQSYSNKP